jgi:hypothetical protein
MDCHLDFRQEKTNLERNLRGSAQAAHNFYENSEFLLNFGSLGEQARL